MNILIAAKHPPGGRLAIGGVQSWSTTVGNELERLGHTVTYWGPEFGTPEGSYDFGIFANLTHTSAALELCTDTLKISHGVVEDERGGVGYAATSEEVADKWGCDGPIIRQPIDLEFWSPSDPGPLGKTLLVQHSYRAELGCLRRIATELGLTYVRLTDSSPEDVRATLRNAAVVVATGRAAVESMACGAPVVIADHRSYQAPLLDYDTTGAMKRNYSGRGGVSPTANNLRVAIGAAIARGSLRDHTEQYHNVQSIVSSLI